MRTLTYSFAFVTLVAAPLHAQSATFDPHTTVPSQLTVFDLRVAPAIAGYVTAPSSTLSLIGGTREFSSLEMPPRTTALSYTVRDELFGSSNRGRNTLKVALIGGAAGFVLGALVATQLATGCDAVTPSDCTILRQRLSLMGRSGGKGAAVGAIVGAGVGAIR